MRATDCSASSSSWRASLSRVSRSSSTQAPSRAHCTVRPPLLWGLLPSPVPTWRAAPFCAWVPFWPCPHVRVKKHDSQIPQEQIQTRLLQVQPAGRQAPGNGDVHVK